MDQDEKIVQERWFKEAIGKPSLLVFADKISLKSGKTAEGLQIHSFDMGKLQYALAEHCEESQLKEMADFFNKALKRRLKIKKGIKGEVIPLKDKP